MRDELQRWQAGRQAELCAPDSWLGMVGLFWLEPGANRVGSGADCLVRLPSGPAWLGDLHCAAGAVSWLAAGGQPRALATDRDGPPATVDHENLSFFIVDRDGRLAARVRDRDWAASRPFSGLEYFAHDPAWCIEADWVALVPALSMTVPNVGGDLKAVTVSQLAVFSVAGQTVALLPMAVDDESVFFVFRDRTSGRQSYGAGRFLKAKPPVDGKISLDFNRAYNPPCAFTPFATCPLPPTENWLPFAVPAGEMQPAKADA